MGLLQSESHRVAHKSAPTQVARLETRQAEVEDLLALAADALQVLEPLNPKPSCHSGRYPPGSLGSDWFNRVELDEVRVGYRRKERSQPQGRSQIGSLRCAHAIDPPKIETLTMSITLSRSPPRGNHQEQEHETGCLRSQLGALALGGARRRRKVDFFFRQVARASATQPLSKHVHIE